MTSQHADECHAVLGAALAGPSAATNAQTTQAVPWAIRIGLEARGIPVGPLPLPASPGRQAQRAAFIEWVPGWLTRVEQALGLSLVGAR